jgi:hypothetical protein
MTNPNQKGPESHKQGFMEFIMTHKWDAAAYFLLFIGLISSIFYQITGGFLVGIILGIYFSNEIQKRFTAFKEYLDKEGVFRGFILIGALIALFITTFGLCIGTLVGVFIRPFLGDIVSSPFDKR